MLFYFHLHECGTVLVDEEGQDVESLADARNVAVANARFLMSSEVLEGRLCLSCSIVIEDEAHSEVDRIPFRDALVVSGFER